MQIVIDIPEEKYYRLMAQIQLDRNFRGCKITSLPEEHGRLVDGSRIEQHLQQKLLKYGIFPRYKQGLEMALNDVVKIAQTIIEADEENPNETSN